MIFQAVTFFHCLVTSQGRSKVEKFLLRKVYVMIPGDVQNSGRTSWLDNYPIEQWWLNYIPSGAEFWFTNTMFEKKLLKITTLWYWGSDKGRQGWCIFLPNEKLNNPRILKNHKEKMMECYFALIQKANFERFSSAVFGSSGPPRLRRGGKGFFSEVGGGYAPRD